MYQDHQQHQHQQQQQYASTSNGVNNYSMHHAGPSSLNMGGAAGTGAIAPLDTTTQPAQANASPLVATGDWTKDLVQLAKTAELKCVCQDLGVFCMLLTIDRCSSVESMR